MGVGIELVNFSRVFHQDGKREKIIVNDLPEVTEDDKARINSLVYKRFDSNSLLSNLPSCECGLYIGEHLRNKKICQVCKTLVVDPLEEKVETLVWVRAPKDAAIVNPVLWTMLYNRFKPNGFSILRWLTETSYQAPDKEPPELEIIKSWNIPRGLSSFYKNFDTIIANLYTLKRYRVKKGETDELWELIRTQRDCVFTDYLPLPNRALLVLEKNNMGNYADFIINGALDAIATVTSMDSPNRAYPARVKENRIVKMMMLLSKYYDDVYAKKLAMKEGIFRKHAYGTRAHFSYRGVIASETGWHNYENLGLSWGIAVTSLSLMLQNKLLRQGMTVNDTKAFLYEHTQKYHPRLDNLFQELIAETPGGLGIVDSFQRNPSLERASAQMFYVNHIKGMYNRPDLVKDPTISLSILDVKGFNADFDGKLTTIAITKLLKLPGSPLELCTLTH